MIDGSVPTLEWSFPESNAAQSYATHGFFRYFGKLPPTVTGKIIDHVRPNLEGPVLDIMCGSGTTLVECCLRGLESYGIDVNPLAVLISRVKSRFFNPTQLRHAANRIVAAIGEELAHRPVANPHRHRRGQLGFEFGKMDLTGSSVLPDPQIKNLNYWFSEEIRSELAVIFSHVNRVRDDNERNFFKVAALSIVRKVSNASPRIGRIFHRGEYEGPSAFSRFKKKIDEMTIGAAEFAKAAKVASSGCLVADARRTPFPAGVFGLVVCHPPYFALYKYSSDVLRFELEWGGFNRRAIARSEIADGFKSTDISMFDDYIGDMKDVLRECQRVLHKKGWLCVVTNNSTFKDERLPVVERIVKAGCADGVGLKLHQICRRKVRFAQATYHRSARVDKVTTEDQMIFFRR